MKSLTKLWWGCCSGLLLMMLLVATQQVALATHITPTFVAGNPTCSQLLGEGTFAFELKVEPVADGVYSLNGVEITVDVRNTNKGQVFDWESSGGVVNGVFVKGGPGGNLYTYNPAATSDTGLHAPLNDNGRYFGLSHISFCVTPGEPSIEVTKHCDQQSVDGVVVTTRNTVTLLNDGDFELTGIQVREETAGLTCKLTKVDDTGVDVALPFNTYVTVPNDVDVDFDGSLAIGEDVDLEVTCTSTSIGGERNVTNTISGKGSSTSGPVEDDGTSDPATCPFNPTPVVSIDKACVAEEDVRLMAMDGVLVAEVCPTIIVTNDSLTGEPLKTAFVFDEQIDALNDGDGVDVIALRGEGPLLAGDEINLGASVEDGGLGLDLCYLPSAPEVSAFEEGKYLPSHAGFLNIASVDADGFFGGDDQDSDDTALRDAEGNILFLEDEEGNRVKDAEGNDIPLSECPLCVPHVAENGTQE